MSPWIDEVKQYEDEPVLDDTMIVIREWIYLIDGIPRRAPVSTTVLGLRMIYGAKTVRKCNVAARKLGDVPVPYLELKKKGRP